MKHWCWTTKKPDFKEECVLIVAQYYGRTHREYENRQYEYTLYEIKKLDGEDEEGKYGWYWGLLCSDGEEWGALEDLHADLYMTMPLLKGAPNVQVSDTTESPSSTKADNQNSLKEAEIEELAEKIMKSHFREIYGSEDRWELGDFFPGRELQAVLAAMKEMYSTALKTIKP